VISGRTIFHDFIGWENHATVFLWSTCGNHANFYNSLKIMHRKSNPQKIIFWRSKHAHTCTHPHTPTRFLWSSLTPPLSHTHTLPLSLQISHSLPSFSFSLFLSLKQTHTLSSSLSLTHTHTLTHTFRVRLMHAILPSAVGSYIAFIIQVAWKRFFYQFVFWILNLRPRIREMGYKIAWEKTQYFKLPIFFPTKLRKKNIYFLTKSWSRS